MRSISRVTLFYKSKRGPGSFGIPSGNCPGFRVRWPAVDQGCNCNKHSLLLHPHREHSIICYCALKDSERPQTKNKKQNKNNAAFISFWEKKKKSPRRVIVSLINNVILLSLHFYVISPSIPTHHLHRTTIAPTMNP